MSVSRTAVLLATLLLVGCDRTPPSHSAKTITNPKVNDDISITPPAETLQSEESESPAARHRDDEPEAVATTETKDATPNETPLVDPLSGKNAESAGQEEVVVSDPVADSRVDAAYRLWLPTSKGPLLVGLDISIDDQPLSDAFEQKLANVRTSIADDPQERLSWDRLLEKVAGDPVTFGRTATQFNGQEKSIVKRFDRDKNGHVDDEELVRFIFRDSNVTDEFRLFGTDSYRWSNRAASPLFAAIDRNQDRKLDASEIEAAGESLLREIDQNADECIDFSEASELSDADENAWQRNRSNRQGTVAMDLAGFVNWSNLSYSMGGMLKEDPIFAPTNPVSMIDGNQDQWISAEEAEAVLEVTPHFTLAIRFNSINPSESTIHTTACTPENENIKIENGAGTSWIAGRSLHVGMVVSDMPPTQNRIPREAFIQIDANKNGAIEEDEIPDAAKDQFPFESLDVNEDGKLSFMEINQAFKQTQSIWNFQVRGRAAEHPDGVFAWLDSDHDQFLSSREIQSAPAMLQSLSNEGELISAPDIPDTLMMQFGRGEPNQDDTRFRFSRRARAASEVRPRWAIRMDANRDGDLSENEFLGPVKAFRDLDLDGDRFLSTDEILAE